MVSFAKVPGSPFGAAISPDGRYGFVTLTRGDVLVYFLAARDPRLLRTIKVPEGATGCSVTADGKLLLIADGRGGDIVLSTRRAETAAPHAVLGTLAPPTSQVHQDFGAIETTSSANGKYVFVSIEDNAEVAVYAIGSTTAPDLTSSAYVGAVPMGEAPVGLALSPDGQHLYVTSEVDTDLPRGKNGALPDGSLSVIDVSTAETDPAQAASATVAAGNQPVRVITSPNGAVVWVTARGSNQVLGFSAAKLTSDPKQALIASVRVGTAPVGIAEFDDGDRLLVANSNRFDAKGAHASLSVINTIQALAHPAHAVAETVKANAFPRDIAINDQDKIALVPNFGSDQLETVHLPAH